MEKQEQPVQNTVDLEAEDFMRKLFRQVEEGEEAEQLLKYVNKVMSKFSQFVFVRMQNKLDSNSLYNLNSLCASFAMIRDQLKKAVEDKKVAEADIREKEGE